MRFVITGANGYIGSEIVKYFQDYPFFLCNIYLQIFSNLYIVNIMNYLYLLVIVLIIFESLAMSTIEYSANNRNNC